MSLPMWERGLKHLIRRIIIIHLQSLPMWERGLKLFAPEYLNQTFRVAPHVGAWIET